MDLQRVETELTKRTDYPYHWGRKQSNSWDHQTNFIYRTYSFESLLKKTKNLNQNLTDYALNRWYNFWSAMAVENIFSLHKNVVPNKNSYDKFIDFTIDNIPFDHKTSVFPKGFHHNFKYAKENKKELIKWLYDNQSQQGRKHLKNRLFLILYDDINKQHWKMKSEIMLLKKEIDLYINNFSEKKLQIFDFGEDAVFSDILWVTKR